MFKERFQAIGKCVIDKDEFFSQLSLISLISESTSLSILFSNLVKTLHFVSIYNFDKMNFFTNFVNIRVYSLVYFTFQISSKHFTLCQFITLFPTFPWLIIIYVDILWSLAWLSSVSDRKYIGNRHWGCFAEVWSPYNSLIQ
jgi:hypothetical protein